jgi:hypothetical protein
MKELDLGRKPPTPLRRAALQGASLAILIAAGSLAPGPAGAQGPPELRLCPRAVVHTCFIGYVTSATKVIVLLSSSDNDPLVGEEVEVAESPPDSATAMLDLSKQIGSVVMLDATGKDRIYSARVMSVADPLLTALYLSTFVQPTSHVTPPE